MISFDIYLLKQKYKIVGDKLLNLRKGDRVQYIGKEGTTYLKHNAIYTFQEFKEFSGQLYINLQEFPLYLINPKNITKI